MPDSSETPLTRAEMHAELQSVEADLQSVKTGLQNVEADLQSVKTGLRNVEADLQSVKTELQSVKADLQEQMRDIETTLLREFHKWAVPVRFRLDALETHTGRLNMVEDRLTALEDKKAK